MTTKQAKKALTSFITIVNETFGSHYSFVENDFCYRVVTDNVSISKYRLAFMPSFLLSVANFSVDQGKIVIDFCKSDM